MAKSHANAPELRSIELIVGERINLDGIDPEERDTLAKIQEVLYQTEEGFEVSLSRCSASNCGAARRWATGASLGNALVPTSSKDIQGCTDLAPGRGQLKPRAEHSPATRPRVVLCSGP